MKFVFDAIGTKWQIDIFDTLSKKESADLLNKINSRIEIFDQAYSRFRTDSLVTKMSHRIGSYDLPDDSKKLFTLYKSMYELSNGAVTPLIGQLLIDAGYDSNYSLIQSKKLSSPLSWEETFTYDYPKIAFKQPAFLDFGAAGKGYLIDIVSEIIETKNIQSYCIDAGQDIKYKSYENKPLRVGLENPDNLDQVIGVAEIKNQSICGSSGNRRKWGKYHHIINPKTMEPVKNILATWTIADSALVADMMATALFFVQPKILTNDYNFEYLVLKADRTINISPKFPGEIFKK